MARAKRVFIAVALLAAGLASPGGRADEARVAVAANFLATVRSLVSLFDERTGHRVLISAGSTGQLYAQIINGAPFDVFLSADRAAPRRLLAAGEAVKGSARIYAVGSLVLWSGPGADAGGALRARLGGGAVRHLVLADPGTAPYGRAARQALKRLGLWPALRDRLAYGASVGQAFQFVASGNAGMGFVALSQVLHYPGSRGRYWKVPSRLYDPLVQEMVLLDHGRSNEAARAFMAFLQSAPGRAVIGRSGYGLPPRRAPGAPRDGRR